MAAPKSEAEALICAICDKTAGNFTCRGCGHGFCDKHVIEHRQTLAKQMDEIIVEHDRLKGSVIEESQTRQSDLLMEQVNQWEVQAHATIREVASQYRTQLSNAAERYKYRITERLESIGQELTRYLHDNTYVETNLDVWTTKLENLRTELIVLSPIGIERGSHLDTPLAPRLLVIETFDDIFNESIGNVKIEGDGKVITHGFWNSFGTARGRGEYSSGCYRFHFKLESDPETKAYGFFFGIISKATLMSDISFKKPGCGWAVYDDNEFHLKRVGGEIMSDHRSIFRNSVKNDIFELLINCDQKKIRLKNKRTNAVNEITVDMNKYPFPWQLNFSLHNWHHRISLLTASAILDPR